MRYYRRYYGDGRCVVVCTHCLATLGMAATFAAAEELEGWHVCGPPVAAEFRDAALRCYAEVGEAKARRGSRVVEFLRGLRGASAGLLFLGIVLVVYCLPNLIEFAIAGYVSPWVLNVLFGDLTGCVCLAVVLRMPRTSVILYVALALLDGWLYATGRISPGTLMWITDAVPTLVVMGRVAQLRGGIRVGRGYPPGRDFAR
ncbi:MAG: hypothetical protein WA476_12210 [Acidobacteriaceae bacterium]